MTVTEELSEGFKETEIGTLPDDWDVKQIKDIANTFSGSTPNRMTEYYWINGNIPWLKSGELNNCLIDKAEEFITERALKETSVKFVQEGTLVVAMYGATAGKVGLIQKRTTINQAICAIELKNNVKTLYCFYWFMINRPNLLRQRFGGAQPNLNQQIIKNILVPLPPLPEQQKIAAVLSAVQEAKEKAENVLSALKELKKSMMKHLFTYGAVSVEEAERVPLKETEIGMIPEHWDVVKIEDVITLSQYGLSVRGNPTGKYPILRMNSMQDGQLDLTNLQYVDVDATTYDKFRLNRGDILFNRTNSYELVGKVAIFDVDIPFVFASYIVRLITDSNKVLPLNLNYCLNWQPTQDRLKMLASRGVSQSNISAAKLKAFSIPLLPLAEQHQIAETLSAIDEKIQAEQAKKNSLDTLFKTLLSLLMTGRVRVKDIEIPA